VDGRPSVRFCSDRVHSECRAVLHGRVHYLARHVVAINSASRRIHPREQNGLQIR
jgi:hypothetical protein